MPQRNSPRIRDLAMYLAGVVLFAGSLTVLWRSMRAVMDIGGYCASGGPYEIAVQCPQGVDILLFLSIWTGLAGVGLVAWSGGRIGPGFAAVAALAWPALFLSLGWNFLEYGVWAPGGPEFGWLIPGVLFVLMGGVPLWFAVRSMRGGSAAPRTSAMGGAGSRGTRLGRVTDHPADDRADAAHTELAQALRQLEGMAAAAAASTTVAEATSAAGGEAPPGSTVGPARPSGMVDQLERLARLHEQGALDEVEYRQAQQAVIDAASRGGTA